MFITYHHWNTQIAPVKTPFVASGAALCQGLFGLFRCKTCGGRSCLASDHPISIRRGCRRIGATPIQNWSKLQFELEKNMILGMPTVHKRHKKDHTISNVVNPMLFNINLWFGDGVYNPFMMISGMAYHWFCHIEANNCWNRKLQRCNKCFFLGTPNMWFFWVKFETVDIWPCEIRHLPNDLPIIHWKIWLWQKGRSWRLLRFPRATVNDDLIFATNHCDVFTNQHG